MFFYNTNMIIKKHLEEIEEVTQFIKLKTCKNGIITTIIKDKS